MLSTNLLWVNCWDSSWVAAGPPPGHFLSLHHLPYLTHESLPSSGVLPGPPPAPLTVLLLPRGCTFSFCEHLFAIISQDSVSFWTPWLLWGATDTEYRVSWSSNLPPPQTFWAFSGCISLQQTLHLAFSLFLYFCHCLSFSVIMCQQPGICHHIWDFYFFIFPIQLT